jgi:hypothetical protein
MSNFSIIAVLVLWIWILRPGGVDAQQSIPIPGTPNGELPTQLLQSRAYCRSLEWQLNAIEKQFPTLSVEVLSARASWQSSPFASGCNAIEKEILLGAGEKASSMLEELDKKSMTEVQKRSRLASVEEARAFMQLVDRRAKGEIEVEMVRANLLWNHKPYQEDPGREFSAGFARKTTHTAESGMDVTFQIPMSWKSEQSPKPELMSFRNCYGHGNVWMTVLVSPTTDNTGHQISAQEKFGSYSEDSLRNEYTTLGISLTSFLKTKVNGMPALMFTREQLYEQLGQRATRAAEVIRVFKGDHMISFQINTLGPEGEKIAASRIEKNHGLFKMIGGSVSISTE